MLQQVKKSTRGWSHIQSKTQTWDNPLIILHRPTELWTQRHTESLNLMLLNHRLDNQGILEEIYLSLFSLVLLSLWGSYSYSKNKRAIKDVGDIEIKYNSKSVMGLCDPFTQLRPSLAWLHKMFCGVDNSNHYLVYSWPHWDSPILQILLKNQLKVTPILIFLIVYLHTACQDSITDVFQRLCCLFIPQFMVMLSLLVECMILFIFIPLIY